MYIHKMDVGFTNILNIGRCAFFIECNKDSGVFIPVDEIFEKCQSSHKVIFTGDPLIQKEEVAKLCKKLVKNNPRISIEIFTVPLIKPIEISSYLSNTIFNILIYTKDDKRYKVDIILLSWYVELGANFIFEIETIEDIDNVISIINSAGIKKSQTFLLPLKHINNLYKHAKFYGINLAPKVEWQESDDDEG